MSAKKTLDYTHHVNYDIEVFSREKKWNFNPETHKKIKL